MKAFKIDSTSKYTMVDLDYAFQLPRVECTVCEPEWKDWGDGFFEFPVFRFDFLNTEEFTFDRVVSLEDFHQIKGRIEQAAGRSVNLIPGCSIGELAGECFKAKLEDFVWGRILYPQISERARDLLAEEGVELLTAECSILYQGRPIRTHLAIQVEPVSLLTEDSLERLGITHCKRCGHFKQPRPQLRVRSRQPVPAVSEGYLLKRKAWPKGQHLVALQETQRVIASQEFMEAVKKHKLKDIQFIECGRFV